jgi:putative Holliday junction resolvase
MQTLGIDYGKSKVGLALGTGSFAEPFKVVRYKNIDELVMQVIKVIKVEEIEKVIVGISEGEMGEESKDFSINLSKNLNIPVVTSDETLTSQDAQRLSIEAGIHQKKRRQMEDAYAAAIMLQNYLDSE